MSRAAVYTTCTLPGTRSRAHRTGDAGGHSRIPSCRRRYSYTVK
eukprot:COSAG03_NODE_792_length_5834_cov_22.439058_8_plen_44_part_00